MTLQTRRQVLQACCQSRSIAAALLRQCCQSRSIAAALLQQCCQSRSIAAALLRQCCQSRRSAATVLPILQQCCDHVANLYNRRLCVYTRACVCVVSTPESGRHTQASTHAHTHTTRESVCVCDVACVCAVCLHAYARKHPTQTHAWHHTAYTCTQRASQSVCVS